MSERPPRRRPGLRPTHYLEQRDAPAEVLARLRAGLEGASRKLDMQWAGRHVLFSLPARERAPWSPWLSVSVRTPEEGGAEPCTVVAQFCPHPQLWTALMLSYMALGSLAVLAGGFGWAQLSMKTTPWAFWGVALTALTAFGLWAGAQLAQRMASDQMDELWELLEDALESPRD